MIAPPLEGLNSAMFEKRAIVYVPGGLVLTADFAKSPEIFLIGGFLMFINMKSDSPTMPTM